MRHDRRFNFEHLSSIHVSDRREAVPMGVVADISLTGLRAILDRPLAQGGQYELRLHVPEGRDEIRQLDITVICTWVRHDAAADRFQVGLSLVETSSEFQDLVSWALGAVVNPAAPG